MAQNNVRPKDIIPDPILTTWAVQYGVGGGFIHDQVAPVMNVQWPEYKFPRYTADQISREIKLTVAPGGKPSLYTHGKPTFVTGSCKRRALDGQVIREVALANRGPFASERAMVEKLTHNIRLDVENSVKTILDAASASASPSVKWDAASGTIAIEKNIDDAKEAFELLCGVPATHMIMPRAVANVVKRNSDIKSLRKGTNESLLIDGEIPDTVFGLRVVIPGAIQNSANPGLAFSSARVWSTDTVYLLHVNPAISADGETLTALSQVRYSEWDVPYAAYRWEETHKSQRVTWVSVDVHQTEETVCADAIYLLTDVLT